MQKICRLQNEFFLQNAYYYNKILVKFIFESVSYTRTCFNVFVLRKYKYEYLLCNPYRFRIMELEGNMNLILTFQEYSTYIMLFSTVPISAFFRLFTLNYAYIYAFVEK